MKRTVSLVGVVAIVALTIAPFQSSFAATPNNVSGSNGLVMIDKRGGLVRFFEPETLQEISNIDLGVGPHELAISPDHKTAYIPKYGDGIYADNPNPGQSIIIIDLESRKVSGTIDVSPYLAPHGLQVDNSRKHYATVEMNRKMLVIDPITKTKVSHCRRTARGAWRSITKSRSSTLSIQRPMKSSKQSTSRTKASVRTAYIFHRMATN